MSKKTIEIVDANGKKFNVSLSDITDMTTDIEGQPKISLEDSAKFPMRNFVAKVVDSEGNEINVAKLLDEAQKDPAKMPKAIDVDFEATHSGRNHNCFVYHSSSMENDAATWMSPFAKPFLKNHDSWSEPLGRTRAFSFGQSELNPDRDTINVQYRITDEDAIPKFLDGRYKTMSIGGQVGTITCGICGKTILKDGSFKFCGHWRGETYNDQVCLWNGTDISYKEGSVVNFPADDWAQVKKITVVTDTGKAADNKEPKDGAGMSKPNVDDSKVLDQLDVLAGEGAKSSIKDGEPTPGTGEPAGTPPAGTTNDGEGEGTEAGEGAGAGTGEGEGESAGAGQDGGGEPTLEDQLQTVTLERDNLRVQLQETQDQNIILEGQVADLTGQVDALTKQVNDLTQQLAASQEDSQDNRQTAIRFAVLNKGLMAQRVVDFELLNGQLTDDKVEDRLKELKGKAAKELTDMVKDLSIQTTKEVRRLADSVKNPGLASNGEKNTILDGEGNGEGTGEKPATTVKDFEDKIVSKYAQ